jgi:hypothetical protein
MYHYPWSLRQQSLLPGPCTTDPCTYDLWWINDPLSIHYLFPTYPDFPFTTSSLPVQIIYSLSLPYLSIYSLPPSYLTRLLFTTFSLPVQTIYSLYLPYLSNYLFTTSSLPDQTIYSLSLPHLSRLSIHYFFSTYPDFLFTISSLPIQTIYCIHCLFPTCPIIYSLPPPYLSRLSIHYLLPTCQDYLFTISSPPVQTICLLLLPYLSRLSIHYLFPPSCLDYLFLAICPLPVQTIYSLPLPPTCPDPFQTTCSLLPDPDYQTPPTCSRRTPAYSWPACRFWRTWASAVAGSSTSGNSSFLPY